MKYINSVAYMLEALEVNNENIGHRSKLERFLSSALLPLAIVAPPFLQLKQTFSFYPNIHHVISEPFPSAYIPSNIASK